MMTPEEISADIFVWFGAIPDGLFGKLDSNGKVIKSAAVVDWLDTAIAICLAESGGDPAAKNANSSASGLWQIITTLHTGVIEDGIRWVEAKTDDDNLDVFDHRVNTYAAGRIYHAAGRKWTPWEAYNTGAYKKYAGKGSAAFDALNSPANIRTYTALINGDLDSLYDMDNVFETAYKGALGISARAIGGTVTGAKTVKSIPDQLGNALTFVRSGAITVGVFVLAVIALILGVVFILMNTNAGKAAANAIPAGKIAKAAKGVKAVT